MRELRLHPGPRLAHRHSELGSGVPLIVCGQEHPCHLQPTCKSSCVCPFIAARAYRDLTCGGLAELRHNHSLRDGETKPAPEVLTKGSEAAIAMSKY